MSIKLYQDKTLHAARLSIISLRLFGLEYHETPSRKASLIHHSDIGQEVASDEKSEEEGGESQYCAFPALYLQQ
jgi:hypothetical protein